MPPKRKQNRSKQNNKNKPPTPVDAMSDCVLPREIMARILTRLPVKSILRFKCVCKPWLNLFSTPKFIKTHHLHFSQHPKNEALIIHSCSANYTHSMSLYNTSHKTPINLVHTYPIYFAEMDFVGCVNGLVCTAMPPYGQWVDLWNPALDVSKTLPLPKLPHEKDDGLVSLGFGYDSVADDFKVVRIVCYNNKKKKNGKTGFEVYSCKSDSWTTIKSGVGFSFSVTGTKCGAIVKGNPYWVAKVDGKSGIMVCFFDVTKMVFTFVPVSSLSVGESGKAPMVDWNGSLALLAWKKNEQRVRSVNVWVFDDAEKIWAPSHTFGPIELKVDRLLQCSKNGKIVGECPDRKLFVFDPVDGSVEKIVIADAEKYSYEIYGYSESLACYKGMESVTVQKEKDRARKKAIDETDFGDLLRYISIRARGGTAPPMPWELI